MSLRNMFPALFMDYATNLLKTDAIFFAKKYGCHSGFRQSSNFNYIGRGKFCTCGFLSTIGKWIRSAASLVVHIADIVYLCPKKKMIWIYTSAIVAFMKNTKAVGDWPIRKIPRYSVRCPILPISKGNSTIAEFMSESLPFPAFVWGTNIYFRPKSFGEWISIILAHVGDLLSRFSATLPDVTAPREYLRSRKYITQWREV